MKDADKSVDALLATTCSRLLNAAAQVNTMRVLHQQQDALGYWKMATVAADNLTIAGCAMTEAHRILLAQQGIAIQQGGELIH
jgi:hypothetical protein